MRPAHLLLACALLAVPSAAQAGGVRRPATPAPTNLAPKREVPLASAQVVGRMTAAFGLGQILGPAIGGWLADRTGSFVAPSLLAAAVLVACAGLLAVTSRRLAASGVH